MAPRVILLRQQKKADSQFIDLFPAAVDTIARMLRAGLPITSAVRSVSAEAPPPVNEVFTMVANQIEIGAPIEEALDAASQQIALADFRFFTVAVALQHATGGNLAATLEILSDIIRRRRGVRLKAKATTAEIRVSAYVLGSLPILIVGALLLIQPGYLTPLFHDPRGHLIIAVAAGLLLLAAVSMRQMMRSVTD
jgi:tight adherence protein B